MSKISTHSKQKTMKKVIPVVFFLFFSLALSAQWNTSHLMRQGQHAFFDDDYVTAIDNFNHIIRVRPYLSEPYFFRGLAKLSLEDANGAVRDFSKALEIDPNYYHALVYRGIAYHHLKQYDQAMEDYNQAVSINPREAYVFANRAITLSELGDYAAAERDYSIALRIDKKLTIAYLNRAILRERQGDVGGALTDCTAAIQLNSLTDEAYGLRGYLKYQQKEYREAIDDFNRALTINPKNTQVLMSRAITWYEMKRFNEALGDLTRAIETDSSLIYAYYNRGLLRAEVGDYNRAIDDLNEVLSMNPDNILIYFNRGLLKQEIKDYVGAYEDFTESITRYPDFVNAYLARAGINSERGDFQAAAADRYKADEILNRYQRMQAGDKNALVDTTENFRRLVDINSRNDRLKEVINGRLQDRKVIVELQDIFCLEYLPVDTLRKGHPQYYNKQVMAYNQSHSYVPALMISPRSLNLPDTFVTEQFAELNRRIKADEGDMDARLLRGIFFLERHEFPRAITDFETIVKSDPDNLFARFNLANARMKMYDYIEDIREQTGRLGEAATQERVDYSRIQADYEYCLKLDPTFVFAWFNLGNIAARNNDPDEAIRCYSRVIGQENDVAEAYYNRGLLYIMQKNIPAATQDLSKAGELGLSEAYSVIKRYCSD